MWILTLLFPLAIMEFVFDLFTKGDKQDNKK